MNTGKIRRTLSVWTMVWTALGLSAATAQDVDIDFDLDINVGVEPGVQVLTRGPVHEAFAGPVTFVPEPGVVVARVPLDPIEEIPPSQRPDGANVAWISGYWSWDDDRDDFLWVSGVWRSIPPGRQWIPGYWRPIAGGVQWTSGYWADVDVEEIEYLPEPPDSIEEVVVNPPSPDYVWVPGVWVWQVGGYAWRPGYWAQLRPNWVWVPACYTWSPRGYVFVDGYWDYVVARRGVLFAPVHFDRGAVAVSYYSPKVAIRLDLFTDHLFVRPHYQHYYFGDYYDVHYETAGFLPSFAFHAHRAGYDPIYVHRRWDHRHESDWDDRLRASYRYRREHVQARPPRTLNAMLDLRSRRGEPEARSLFVATTIDRLAKRQASPVRFKEVDSAERSTIEERSRETKKSRQERVEVERQVEPRAPSGKQAAEPRSPSEKEAVEPRSPAEKEAAEPRAPVKVKAPKSPIKAKAGPEADDDKSPPKRQVTPKPDPSVKPKPKQPKSEKPREAPKGKSKKDKDD